MTKHFLRQWRNTVRGGGGPSKKQETFSTSSTSTGSTSSPSTGKIRRWIMNNSYSPKNSDDLRSFLSFLSFVSCFPVFFLSFFFFLSYPFFFPFLVLSFPFLFLVDKFSGACFLIQSLAKDWVGFGHCGFGCFHILLAYTYTWPKANPVSITQASMLFFVFCSPEGHLFKIHQSL